MTHARLQLGDPVEQLGLFFEPRFALDFRKDRAEAVLPEAVGRDQHAIRRAPQHDLVRVMAARRDDTPVATAQHDAFARGERRVEHEARTLLARRAEAQPALVPGNHRRGLARRNRDRGAEVLLQVRVATAVIRMQMRVDDARESAAADHTRNQRARLRGMRDVAGVDDARRLGRVEEHDVVRRQPAALEDVQRGRQMRDLRVNHAPQGWRCAAAMVRNASRSSAVPA